MDFNVILKRKKFSTISRIINRFLIQWNAVQKSF